MSELDLVGESTSCMYQASGHAIAAVAAKVKTAGSQVNIVLTSQLEFFGIQHCVSQIEKRKNDYQNDDDIHEAPRDFSIHTINAHREAKPTLARRKRDNANIVNSFSSSD